MMRKISEILENLANNFLGLLIFLFMCIILIVAGIGDVIMSILGFNDDDDDEED